MKHLFTTLMLLCSTAAIAEDKTLPQIEIDKKIVEIKTEGMLLYRSERCSWLASDVLRAEHSEYMDKLKGYFSYVQGNAATCIFYNKADKVIATISYDNIIADEHARTSYEERDFSKLEQQYYKLRSAATTVMDGDTMFKYYNNTNFNMVCIANNNRNDVYLITGTAASGVILFGNDYLMRFDKDLKLVSKEGLHRALIPVSTENESDSAMGSIHTHLPGYSPFITPTDICTSMLYKDFTKGKMCHAVSEHYLSIWNNERQTLIIIPMDGVRKMKRSDTKHEQL